MPIVFDKEHQVFHISNQESSYCIQLSQYNDLLHLYWGARIDASQVELLMKPRASFSGYSGDDYTYSLDVLPQEYPSYGNPDMRTPAYQIKLQDGSRLTKLKYEEHIIYEGKPEIKGLPAVYSESADEATTLEILLKDHESKINVRLFYTVVESMNVICRNAVIENESSLPVDILSAMSMSVDFHSCDYRYMHLHGAWARERHIEISPVCRGWQGIDSKRGASGVCENPFIALLARDASEDFGEVYGISLIYSGNFKMNIEVEQYGTMRVQAGINPFDFLWRLMPGETFSTPEAVMVYSNEGLGGMSRTYHKLYRTRLCRGYYRDRERPILINNWEATYFDFNEEKLLAITKTAGKLGIELFVLDDGWFGKRNDDTSSLGDWFVNKTKLPNGVEGLCKKVNEQGLMFGIWVEPEMISPDSELFRKHPDWAIGVHGKERHKGRHQYILDLTRDDVCEYVIEFLTELLASAPISYVKWDMNRNMTDIYSSCLQPERQGEVAHRYMLNLYKILETVTTRFPKVLFEGCSGGGGRFDPGMLYYAPQLWASDDTDAIERLYIQYATSMVYPASAVCAHVSVVPNHQVGRVTPFELRSKVAMSGNLGYEFDLNKLDMHEQDMIKQEVEQYKDLRSLVQQGDYYRLMNPFEDRSGAWMFVSEDKEDAVVFYFNKLALPNAPLRRIKLKGLDVDKEYEVEGKNFSGKTLMNYGLWLPADEKDFESRLWILREV